MSKGYIVLNPSGREGVFFKNKRDAKWTATGKGIGWLGVPTIGAAFREAYEGEGPFKIIEVDVATKPAQEGQP